MQSISLRFTGFMSVCNIKYSGTTANGSTFLLQLKNCNTVAGKDEI